MLHATMFAFYTGIHGIHVDFTSSARAQVPRQRCPHRPSTSSLLISLSYRSRKKSSHCDTSQKSQTRQVTLTLGPKAPWHHQQPWTSTLANANTNLQSTRSSSAMPGQTELPDPTHPHTRHHHFRRRSQQTHNPRCSA